MRRNYWFILVLLFAAPMRSQTTGEISGIVRDSTQNPLPGIRITVINQATRSEAILYTDPNGFYRAVNLEPQFYTVEATRGTETTRRTDLTLRPGATLRLDLEFGAGATGGLPPSGTWRFLIVSALVPALVALLVTEPGKKLLRLLWVPIERAKSGAYGILAPRFPNRIGLPGYKKRVLRSHLVYIESPVGPQDVRVPLEKAFAPIAVITGDKKEATDLFSFAGSHERFILLGGPGTGKTTLMKSLITNILRRQCHMQLNHLIPVLVVLRDMARANHSVEQAVSAALANFEFKDADRLVEAALKNGRFLIVLDGLDEVGANREAVAETIRKFCNVDEQRIRRNRLVITCREVSYRTRDLADVVPTIVRIEAFTPQHMRIFLKGWPEYNGRVALRLYQHIQDDPQIHEICRNPLLLTILTGLYLEKDKFHLPSSRDHFYRTSIDELIVQRPGRRGMKQKFGEDHKWQVLQRASLERLETVQPDEDPESLQRDRLFHYAREVMGADLKEADFREFINELVNTNGVIKQGAEDSYIFGHRTFQEYFAAREAHRTRTAQEMLDHFSGRPELSEILYFYCGLMHNIPQLNSVLSALSRGGQALLAGRCLVNATETPATEVAEAVIEPLFLAVWSGPSYEAELEVLSSLGQRPGPIFELARRRLTELIDFLRESSGVGGAAGLVSALATRENIAMDLVPGLLNHNSPEWRAAGARLMFSLGTDEALDRLVQLLASTDEVVRHEAAILISDLIPARAGDLKQRAMLVPERQDLRVWPLEDYLPGRIAIPVVEGLVAGITRGEGPAQVLPPLLAAAIATVGRGDSHWLKLRRDLRLRTQIRAVMRAVTWASLAASLGWLLLVIIVFALCTARREIALLQTTPPRLRFVSDQSSWTLSEAARRLWGEVQRSYPPQLGWKRILPWNWDREPAVPSAARDGVMVLKQCADPTFFHPESNWAALQNAVSGLALAPATVAELQSSVRSVQLSMPQPTSRARLWIMGYRFRGWATWLMVMCLLVPLYGIRASKPLRGNEGGVLLLMRVSFLPVALAYPFLTVPFFLTSSKLTVLAGLVPAGALMAKLLLDHYNFPPNRYLYFADQLHQATVSKQ